MKLLKFVQRFYGPITLGLGGVMAAGSFSLWVAEGGLAPFSKAIRALGDERVSEALSNLPETQRKMTIALDEISARLDTQAESTQQISDSLDAYRQKSEDIVVWASDHSQRLTNNAGPCVIGEPCQVFFRGRRTQAGAQCTLREIRPQIRVEPTGTYPVALSKGYKMRELGDKFATIPVSIKIPEFVGKGVGAVILLNIYSDCPFSEDKLIERSSFPLKVEISET